MCNVRVVAQGIVFKKKQGMCFYAGNPKRNRPNVPGQGAALYNFGNSHRWTNSNGFV